MRNFILFGIVVTALCGRSLSAEPLNGWLLAQVQKDEQLLADALTQTDGHTLYLLEDSRTYIPFFLEAPRNHTSDLVKYKPLFDAWGNQGFLPGGYIFRIRFAEASPLYATSAGVWDGTTWHSLSLDKDLMVSPGHVWNGSGNDYLFATRLWGPRSKFVVYDQHGEVKQEEEFDPNDADFEQRLAAAEQPYVANGSAVFEMLSLAEYLENPDASWREADLDLSGQFNLRNQQQRDSERERLKSALPLTRNAAIEALQSKSSPEEPQLPHASSEPMPAPPKAPDPIKLPKAEPTPVEDSPSHHGGR